MICEQYIIYLRWVLLFFKHNLSSLEILLQANHTLIIKTPLNYIQYLIGNQLSYTCISFDKTKLIQCKQGLLAAKAYALQQEFLLILQGEMENALSS